MNYKYNDNFFNTKIFSFNKDFHIMFNGKQLKCYANNNFIVLKNKISLGLSLYPPQFLDLQIHY